MEEFKEEKTPSWPSAAALTREHTVAGLDLHDSSDTDGESVGSEDVSDESDQDDGLGDFLASDEDDEEQPAATGGRRGLRAVLETLGRITCDSAVKLKQTQLFSFLSQATLALGVSVSLGTHSSAQVSPVVSSSQLARLLASSQLQLPSPLPPVQLGSTTSWPVITLQALQTLMSSMETPSSSTPAIVLRVSPTLSSTHRLWQSIALLGTLKGIASAMLSNACSSTPDRLESSPSL